MLRDIFKIVITFTILYLSTTFVMAYINESLALLPTLAIPLFILWFAKHLANNTEYRCKCGNEFKISAIDVLLSLQQLYLRLLKCPKCNTSSWCRVVRYKGNEVKAKFKQIDENVKTNYKALITILMASYLLFFAFWLLNKELLLFIVMSFVYLYFIAVLAYGMKNKLNSSMYSVITLVVVFITFIMLFVNVVVYLSEVSK
ncbi:hypothetical protein DRP05_01615 [Archaeoglobales archaeon]|nr:MAG: hypothetical protein DRP05_01615 [Archaeoglobales archaeon]